MNEPLAVYASPCSCVAPANAPITGATLATLAEVNVVSVSPSLSVTVRLTVNTPSCA